MTPTTFPDGPRVLVVDDNLAAAEMLAAALTARGYQIKVTHDGSHRAARRGDISSRDRFSGSRPTGHGWVRIGGAVARHPQLT
jgi:hypothetical protein